MLFLLKDDQGHALLLAQAANQSEADNFGRNNLPEFCGKSIEVDPASQVEAEEFWGVRTVHLVHVALDPKVPSRKVPAVTFSHVWVRGPELPEEVEDAGLLTPEDRAALTLDHVTRTSDVIGRIQIRLHSFVR